MLLASNLHAKCVIIERRVYILFKKHLNTLHTQTPLFSTSKYRVLWGRSSRHVTVGLCMGIVEIGEAVVM